MRDESLHTLIESKLGYLKQIKQIQGCFSVITDRMNSSFEPGCLFCGIFQLGGVLLRCSRVFNALERLRLSHERCMDSLPQTGSRRQQRHIASVCRSISSQTDDRLFWDGTQFSLLRRAWFLPALHQKAARICPEFAALYCTFLATEQGRPLPAS